MEEQQSNSLHAIHFIPFIKHDYIHTHHRNLNTLHQSIKAYSPLPFHQL